MRTFKKGELAKQILLTTIAGGAIAAVCVLPGLSILFKMFDARSTKDRYRLQRSIQNMERQGLLTRRIHKGREQLVVSEKGKEHLRSYLAEDLRIPSTSKWDKKWRIAMFDIPEEKGKIRREVSWKLRDIGMYAIQNSVFISPFPCKKEIDKVTSHYNVSGFFVYFEADTIELREDLLRHFNLR